MDRCTNRANTPHAPLCTARAYITSHSCLHPVPTVDYAATPLGDPRRRAAPHPVPWYGAYRTTWHRYPLTPRVACRIIPAERLRDSPASPKKPFPRPDVDDEVYDAVFTF